MQPKPSDQRNGRITRLIVEKGYGFIADVCGAAGAPELFFHKSGIAADSAACWEQLAQGDDVTFRVMTTEKGPRAYEVRFR